MKRKKMERTARPVVSNGNTKRKRKERTNLRMHNKSELECLYECMCKSFD